MPGTVVDASVIGAICFGEDRADEAAALLRGQDLWAPTLLVYELMNIARAKCRRSPADTTAIMLGLSTGLLLSLNLMDVNPLDVVRLANEAGFTGYDASYLHCAIRLGMPVVTFDRQLGLAARARAL